MRRKPLCISAPRFGAMQTPERRTTASDTRCAWRAGSWKRRRPSKRRCASTTATWRHGSTSPSHAQTQCAAGYAAPHPRRLPLLMGRAAGEDPGRRCGLRGGAAARPGKQGGAGGVEEAVPGRITRVTTGTSCARAHVPLPTGPLHRHYASRGAPEAAPSRRASLSAWASTSWSSRSSSSSSFRLRVRRRRRPSGAGGAWRCAGV